MASKKSYRIRNLEGTVNQGYVKEKFEQKEQESVSNVQENRRQKSEIRIVPFLSLFKYSTRCDQCYILGGILLAILGSLFLPLINILYGDFCNMMVERQYPREGPSTNTFLLKWLGGGRVLENSTAEERRVALEEDAIAWGIGCAILSFFWFLFAILAVFLLNIAAARQILRIKLLFFKAVVCQDMAWFDTEMDGNFVGKNADNLKKLESGIGGVVGIFIHLIAIFVVGVVMAFFYGWQLTLAILSIIPLAVGIAVYAIKMQSKLEAVELTGLTAAGKNAEEVFTCIRTVVAFGGEKKEVERYSRNLTISTANGIKQGLVSGITDGLLWLLIYSSYSVAFGYGIRLIEDSRENKDEIYTPATLLIIFYGIFSGLVNIAYLMIHMQTFAEACGAAGSVFDVISSKGLIQPCSDAGEVGEECRGEIEFRNVRFEYPARKSVKLLQGLNLKIKAGEIVALVGESGSGKSTILQLIQRMYDPLEGEVLLDGKNIKSLKVCWLRQQMGVVGQEPLLFSTTIRENILYGFAEATDDKIREAAKKANAHGFITKQPNGYETLIGQRGSTLSGGQKQRIAIARALIRNPKVLLLDEATSALDTSSEKIVQAALDKAAVGRTTLIVTHKLSTIANVDRIIVISNGAVVEDGTPADLYNAKGKYYELLQSQAENVGESLKSESDTRVRKVPSARISSESSHFSPMLINNKYGNFSSLSFRREKESFEKQSKIKKVKFKEMLKWSKPEWGFLIVGALGALLAGAALPVVLILLGFALGLLAKENISEILDEFDIYVVSIFVVGCISSICVFLQIYCLTVSGMKLSERLRIRAFKSMIHQDMAWFDDDRNKVGALCLRLTQEPMRVQAGTGNRIGILTQAFSTAFISVVVSLFFTWKLTLVTLAAVPLVFVGAYMESFFGQKPRAALNLSMENASKIAAEVIANIKVVASLGKESYFIEKYTQAIYEGKRSSFYMAWLQGLAFGFGQAGPFFCYSISLWYGGYLAANENIEYKYVMTVTEMLIFGTWTLGQCMVFLSSFREAKEAAEKLQYLFTRKPKITDGQLDHFPNMRENGTLKFSKVRFGYPAKHNTPVLENFNATVQAGQSVAIMGPSGSGKSTIVQLLLRFYDPDYGRINVNEFGINDYKLSCLRQQFGFVSQEPVLFDRTVFENVAYGDNSRNVLTYEVVEAARAANIHSFIASLPQGYETKLGISGAHLSGGQKQRIAIARALIRNPQILLLDEATSALDPRSEQLVQETLDSASSGRTTITIAHRLGAVRNANLIYVVDKGVVQEYGTHQELMNLGGLYFSMHEGEGEKDKTENDSQKK